MGLERGLLLDLYLGSQKLREILMLLYRITLSSSRKKPTQCSRGSTHFEDKANSELALDALLFLFLQERVAGPC